LPIPPNGQGQVETPAQRQPAMVSLTHPERPRLSSTLAATIGETTSGASGGALGYGFALRFGLAYGVAILLGHGLSLHPSEIATVWPAAGLYLVALTLHAPGRWPLLLLVGSVMNFLIDRVLFDRGMAMAVGFCVANGCAAIAGATLVRGWSRLRERTWDPGARLSDTLVLCAVAVVAPLVGAGLGAAVLWSSADAPFLAVSRIWWAADALGILLAAPLMLSLAASRRPPVTAGASRAGETVAALLFVALTSGLVFGTAPMMLQRLDYLVLPGLLWCALRLRRLEVSVALGIVAVAASAGSAAGLGSFSAPGLQGVDRVQALQLFLCVLAGATQIVAAVKSEREAARLRLADANLDLEHAVERRTAELTRTNRVLAGREATLRSMIDASPVGVLRHAAGGVVVAANDAFLQLAGRSRADVADGHILWRSEAEGGLVARPAPAAEPKSTAPASQPNSQVECELAGANGRRVPVLVSETSAEAGSGEATAFVVDLTELRRGQEALRERAALLEATSDCVFAMDADWRITFVNQRAQAVLGLSHVQLGQRLWDLFPQSVGGPFWQAYHRSRDERVTAQAEAVGPKLGRRIRAESHPSGDGGIVVFFRDVTDERRNAVRLEESEARLRLFVERAPAAIAMFDAEMRYLAVSRRFLSDYRLDPALTPALVQGRSHGEVLPELAARWADVHARVLHGETLSAEEDPFDRADGRVDWVRWEMTPWFRGDGSVGGALLFSEVITARLEAERALAEREARFRALFTAIDEGYCLCEMVLDEGGAPTDYRFLEVNPLFETMTGIRAPVGRTAYEMVPNLEPSWVATYARVGLHGETLRFEQSSDALGRCFDVFATPVGARGRFALVFKDVTERRQAEAVLARGKAELEALVEERTRALRETERRLTQAAKMEALGRLAGGIAHDFNNVLQAVQSGIALASRRMRTDPDTAQRFLDLVQESAVRGASVTRRLLGFARRGDLAKQAVDLVALLDGLAEMLRHTMGPEVALTARCEPGIPAVLADAAQLESVLVNLAGNARDALVGGRGSITLAASRRLLGADEPGVPAGLAPGEYVMIEVIDDGAGMVPEVLARVTEPFFTTKPPGEGTGLGLAMANGFAEQSRGALVIRSESQNGTTVALWLPVADGAVTARPPEAAGRPAATDLEAARSAVLLVDDEPGLRHVLSTSLVERGHGVRVAEHAEAALALLRQDEPVDVLVTDLTMPGGLDGLGLIEAARALRPGLPAILVTGHFGDATRGALQSSVGNAPSAVLQKPVTAEALAAQIVALVGPAA